ncbi:MAG: 30S ribosomal protein S20 [Deltaproteobacteria bacterium]
MANHKSALKRARQNDVRRVRNKGYKTTVKKAIKAVRTEVADSSPEKAREDLVKAVSIIQKSASKGIIHKNQAARKISRLTRRVNQLTASEG